MTKRKSGGGGAITTIVFDYDGVIVKYSELIKRGAWTFVARHPDIGDRVVVAEAEQYYERAKGSRYDILKRVFEKLGKPAAQIPALVEKHATRYNAMVQGGMKELGISAEDREVLRQLSTRYALYINSGTPEEGIQATAKNLGITGYFKGIYGMPSGKVKNLERALKAEQITTDQMVFIGDSDWDYEAAEKFGCRFIGFQNPLTEWGKASFPLVTSLAEIWSAIGKFNRS